LDGRIVGNWSPSARDGGIDLFEEGLILPEPALTRQLAAYRASVSPGQ